jgi:hypothetical protein
MLWLFGEPVGPYWRDMGVKVVGNATQIGGRRPSSVVLPRGLEVEARKMCFTTRIGGPGDLKAKGT